MKVGVGRYSELVRRLFGISELDALSEVAPEIVATISLENDPPEFAYISGARWTASGNSRAGGIGVPSLVQYRNPANSDTIVRLHGLVVSVTVATRVFINLIQTTSDLATVANRPFALDTRYFEGGAVPTTGASPIIVSNEAAALPAGAVSVWQTPDLLALTPFAVLEVPPLVLSQGYAVIFSTADNNDQLRVGTVWRERAAQKYEK